MSGVARVGDSITTGHGCEATALLAGPGVLTVLVNGKPVCGVGDLTAPHLSGVPPVCVSHTMPIISGNARVLVGGRPIARIGDPVDAGAIATGSLNVLA